MDLLKRMTALALAGVLSLSLLTGCQSGGGASSSSSASQSGAQTESLLDLETIGDVCTYLTGLGEDEVVATADGIEITAKELIYWLSTNADEMMAYYYYYYGVAELPWDTADDTGETTLAQYMMADAMEMALLQRLIEKKAGEEGRQLSAEDQQAIQTALEGIREDAAAQGVTAELLLWEQGLTPELFAWNYECDYFYQDMAEELFGENSDNPPTKDSLLAQKEQAGYYKVKHILRATIDTTTREALDDAAKAQKKEQAEEILSQLKASKEPLVLFDELMNEHSEDPGLITNPEGYEFQTNTSVDPTFEEAALALEEGEISGIVEGVSGYHIILRLPLDIDFEAEKDQYVKEQMAARAKEWIGQTDLQKTPAFDKLDPRQMYDNLNLYRDAVSARLEQRAEKE